MSLNYTGLGLDDEAPAVTRDLIRRPPVDVVNDTYTTIPGTSGNDLLNGSSANDTFTLGDGGHDTVHGNGGSDTVEMGAAFDASDQLDATGDTSALLRLDGNYAAGVVMTATTLTNFTEIHLYQGVGNAYRLTFNQATDPGGHTLAISSQYLTTEAIALDASLVAGGMNIDLNYLNGPINYDYTGSFTLLGGGGDDIFNVTADMTHGVMDGGTGHDEAAILTANGVTVTLNGANFRNFEALHVDDGTRLVLQDGAVPLTGLAVTTQDMDASAVTRGSIFATGGVLDDTLIGGAGNDTLDGYTGHDDLEGGAGDDIIRLFPYYVPTVFIDGGAGYDTFEASLYASPDVYNLKFTAFQNIEKLKLILLEESSDSNPIRMTLVHALSAGQHLLVSIPGHVDTLQFDASDDTLGNYTIDYVAPRAAADSGDVVTTGSGDDTFILGDPSGSGGSGDTFDAGGGVNTLDYSASTQALTISNVLGAAVGSGSDYDTVVGFSIFKFGSGQDKFLGSARAETVYMDHGGGHTVDGSGGDDRILLGGSLLASDNIGGGDGSDTVVLQGNYIPFANALNLTDTTLTNIETLEFDQTVGSANQYYVRTAQGTVASGATLTVDASRLAAGSNVTFIGSAETDGRFVYIGGAGGDIVLGGEGADSLGGGAGNDILFGGGGADALDGGAGLDTLSYSTQGATAAAGVTISLAVAGAQDTHGAGVDTVSNFENLSGSLYNDRLTGSDGDNFIDGGAGGGQGNDSLSGGKGADTLYGGVGNDTMDGGKGIDTVAYSLVSDSAASVVKVDLSLTTAQDTGGGGIDLIVNVENLTGSFYNDTLTGSAAANVISGGGPGYALAPGPGRGDDRLDGAGGNDTLFGGVGADTLIGGSGADQLSGGAGADRFAFNAAPESTAAATDAILDFNRTEGDLIDLHLIDAVTGGGDNAFRLVAAFTHKAGELVVTHTSGHAYVVQGDVDGDGVADLTIDVTSATVLAKGDFVL